MFEIGRICMKIAGRDAGLRCVIVDVVDKNNVIIDGQTRRRKCNIKHIEPLDLLVKIAKGAPFSEVKSVFKKEFKIDLKESKPKKAAKRSLKQRKKKEKPVKEAPKKTAKKTVAETIKTEATKIETKKVEKETVKTENKK